jgi:hypothetical protein
MHLTDCILFAKELIIILPVWTSSSAEIVIKQEE